MVCFLNERRIVVWVALLALAMTIALGTARGHPIYRIAVDGSGAVYFIDAPSRCVLKVSADGKTQTVIDFTKLGIGTDPHALAIGPEGRLHIAETYGQRIWILEEDGKLRLHPWCARPDDGLGVVQDLQFGPKGRLHLLRRGEQTDKLLESTRRTYSLQRLEEQSYATLLMRCTDLEVDLYASSFTIDTSGRVWIAKDSKIYSTKNSEGSSPPILIVIAGHNERGLRQGKGAEARFKGAYGIAAQASGTLLIADQGNHCIRHIDTDGVISAWAGTGTAGNSDGQRRSATFDHPFQVAVGTDGTVAVLESVHHGRTQRVRVVQGNTVRTLATLPVGKRSAPWPADRSLETFRTLSAINATAFSHERQTGLDAISDWPRSYWIECGVDGSDKSKPILLLSGIQRLSVSETKELAGFIGHAIFLPDLRSLSLEAANNLVGSAASLYLDGLSELTPDLASVLAKCKGNVISLGNATSISEDVARKLTAFKGSLHLNGLREASPALLRLLAKWRGPGERHQLSLGGLTQLSPAQAKAIATCKGWGVALNGIKELTPDLARELAQLSSPNLALNGVLSMNAATAKAMSSWKRKFLSLDRMTKIPTTLRALVEAGSVAVTWRSLSH